MRAIKVILILGALAAERAYAAPYLIGNLLFDNTGFQYSLFHEGTGPGAMSGMGIGWMKFNDAWRGSSLAGTPNDGKAYYDDSTGALEFMADLCSDPSNCAATTFGSATAIGTGFAAPALSDASYSKNVVASILWTVNANAGSSLANWISGGAAVVNYQFTTHFVDRKYIGGAGPSNTDVNGVNIDISSNPDKPIAIALWGARGDVGDIDATANGDHLRNSDYVVAYTDGRQIGVDLGIEVGGSALQCDPNDPNCIPCDPNDPNCHPPVVPEPATVALLITGLVGLAGYGWQRRKAA